MIKKKDLRVTLSLSLVIALLCFTFRSCFGVGVVVDDTPPIITPIIPVDGGRYTRLVNVTVKFTDKESGILMEDDTRHPSMYDLATDKWYWLNRISGDEYEGIYYMDFARNVEGVYQFRIGVVNRASLTSWYEGQYTIGAPIVDNSPPRIYDTVPANTQTYVELNNVSMTAQDLESGLKFMSVEILDSFATRLFLGNASITGTVATRTWVLPTPIKSIGQYRAVFYAENIVGLSTTKTVAFSIYAALQGKWYVTDSEIISSTQTVYTSSPTVPFRFVKTAGVADALITCEVWEGAIKLLTLSNTASGTWEGSYTFTAGTHSITLKAYDGTTTITFSVVKLQFSGSAFPTIGPYEQLLLISSAIAGSAIAAVLIVRKRKT